MTRAPRSGVRVADGVARVGDILTAPDGTVWTVAAVGSEGLRLTTPEGRSVWVRRPADYRRTRATS